MTAAPNVAAKVRADLRRGKRLLLPVPATAIAIEIVAGVVWAKSRPGEIPLGPIISIAIAIPATFAVFFLAFGRHERNVTAFVERIGPRVREARYSFRRYDLLGLTLVFDNGLILTARRNFHRFELLFRPDGSVLPGMPEEWGSSKAVGISDHLPPTSPLRAELEQLRGALGCPDAYIALFSPRSWPAGRWAAAWRAIAWLPRYNCIDHPNEIRPELDRVERLLGASRLELLAPSAR
jgi:hypothetical protein